MAQKPFWAMQLGRLGTHGGSTGYAVGHQSSMLRACFCRVVARTHCTCLLPSLPAGLAEWRSRWPETAECTCDVTSRKFRVVATQGVAELRWPRGGHVLASLRRPTNNSTTRCRIDEQLAVQLNPRLEADPQSVPTPLLHVCKGTVIFRTCCPQTIKPGP